MDGGVFSSLGSGSGTLTGLVAIALGLVACFFGCRLLRVVLATTGFVLGAVLVLVVASLVGRGEPYVLLAAAAVGGIIGAVIVLSVYKLGVFLVGATAGALLGGTVGATLGGDLRVAVIVLAAVAVGIVALLFQGTMIILATACSGSWVAAQAGASLLAGRTLEWGDLLSSPLVPAGGGWYTAGFVAVWLVLGIAGAVVQFRSRK
jgi:hypothetical protein